MLQVIDEEPGQQAGAWHLLEEDGALFINAYCSHSFIDYHFLMQLTDAEVAHFRQDGRAYLSKLAYDVHWTAPIVQASTSSYKPRNLTPTRSAEVRTALEAWRNNRAP